MQPYIKGTLKHLAKSRKQDHAEVTEDTKTLGRGNSKTNYIL